MLAEFRGVGRGSRGDFLSLSRLRPGGSCDALSPPIPAPAAHGCESPISVERQKGMPPSSPEGLRPFGTAPSDSPPCKDTSKSDKRGVRAALLAHLPHRGSCRGSPFSRSGSMLRAQRSAMPGRHAGACGLGGEVPEWPPRVPRSAGSLQNACRACGVRAGGGVTSWPERSPCGRIVSGRRIFSGRNRRPFLYFCDEIVFLFSEVFCISWRKPLFGAFSGEPSDDERDTRQV